MTMELPADLSDLTAEAISQAPRLLALQDRDPDSPMRGCMHPAFWRDKSSDVADMRRQEAALAFALLWKHPFPGNRYAGDREILLAAFRAMGFWTRNQHRDGTFDEWYKNEHGYATTAFSSFAMALALGQLAGAIPQDLEQAVLASLARAGDWLCIRDDWFKTNHQAVGVAALGAISVATGCDRYRDAGLRNAHRILERMHPEGWSSEISGLDLGYTFLLAEYLAMFAVLTGEEAVFEGSIRAYEFACHFLHPDLTTGAEYGICANPYFSRVATVALASRSPMAGAALRWMERPSPTPRDTSSTLKDDLRLARYAYQPLLAAAIHSGALPRKDPAVAAGDPAILPFESRSRSSCFPAAGLLSISRPDYAAWAAASYGGYVRAAFRNGGGFLPMFGDRGFCIQDGAKVYRNARYSLDSRSAFEDGALRVTAPFVRAGFVMPPYWARVGLRIATSLPGGPRASRWLIDVWRRRKGTALNQSAGGISAGGSPLDLIRTVRFEDGCIRIADELATRRGALDPSRIFFVMDGPVEFSGGILPDADRRIPLAPFISSPPSPRGLRIEKILGSKDGKPCVLELHVRPLQD